MKHVKLVVLGGMAIVALAQVGCSTTATNSNIPQSAQSAPDVNSVALGGAVQKSAASSTPSIRPTFENVSVYFDYDSTVLNEQSNAKLRATAAALSGNRVAIEIEGNADERGSREYNMALGQKRAAAVKRALAALGVNGDQIETISYGEDKPKAKGHDEAAWAENRRADVVKK